MKFCYRGQWLVIFVVRESCLGSHLPPPPPPPNLVYDPYFMIYGKRIKELPKHSEIGTSNG